MTNLSADSLVPLMARLLFSPPELDRVHGELERYGLEPCEREVMRVRLAILKLSAGSFEGLVQNVEAAKRDYRDVLAWAEYPEEFALPPIAQASLTPTELTQREAARRRDREQYLSWLNRAVPGASGPSGSNG